MSRRILHGLRDVILDPSIVAGLSDHPGYEKSLLRLADARIAFAEAESILRGEPVAEHGPLEFTFSCALKGFDAPHRIDFAFPHGPGLLGRMMAVIGKNGTGKTRLALLATGKAVPPSRLLDDAWRTCGDSRSAMLHLAEQTGIGSAFFESICEALSSTHALDAPVS